MKKTIIGTLTLAFAFTATLAFAENASSTPRGEVRVNARFNASTTKPTARPLLRDRVASSTKMVDSACAKAAVDVRKSSLVSIYGAFTTSLNTALITREAAVKASFDLNTKSERAQARASARAAYKKSVKAAYEKLRTDEKATMKTYSTSIKACGGTNAEASDESSDGSFSASII